MNNFNMHSPFLILLGILCLVPPTVIAISGLFVPRSEGAEKRTTYESGIEPMGEAWIQFSVRYYMYALVFVIFDVETMFLYPWAVVFDQVGALALLEVCVFLFILLIGLVYAWRKGALEWL